MTKAELETGTEYVRADISDARLTAAETRADAAEAECARLRAALESGSDALTHALYLLDANCNQRVSMEAALRRMDAALARDG